MKRILVLFIGLTITLALFSHPWKPNHYVIIDTDGGIDDMRALAMFLASPDVRVLAVTVSSGALNADSAYARVKNLLRFFHHEGLPVAINRKCSFKSPDFSATMSHTWGPTDPTGFNDARESISLMKEILSLEKTKISFVCLGGLSTAALASREIKNFSSEVSRIIWSSDGITNKSDFNYCIDKPSAEKMMKGEIPVTVVNGLKDEVFYDDAMLKAISQLPGIYPEAITDFFKTTGTMDHKFLRQATDELVAIYLHYPVLFTKNEMGYFECLNENLPGAKDGTLKILAGETVNKNQVIKGFPSDPAFYFDDLAPNVTGIIRKYGRDEWNSGVIANELHRHLGVFAIIGVKMGIRAREYFNTGVDEFSAISFAGSVPPLSCMNDGVQVSTGATPGHGLLTVKNEKPAPSVEFTYMNRKIILTLKPEIANRISSELKEINYIYGLDSNIYWELVRKNTIKYWLELDRHEIFEIAVIDPSI